MAKWLITTIGATAIFVSVVSANSSAPQTELLTYSELLQLRPAERVLYINDVRNLLVELSSSKEGRFSDSDPVALRSRLKAWLNILSAAEAQTTTSGPASVEQSSMCSSSSECVEAAKLCYSLGQKLYWDEKHFDCSAPLPRIFLSSTGASQPEKFDLFMTKLPNPRLKPNEAQSVQLSSGNFLNNTSTGESVPVGSIPHTAFNLNDFIRQGIVHGQPVANCRSKHQSQNFPQTSGWPECTDAQELEIASAFQKVQPQNQLLRPVQTAYERPVQTAFIIRAEPPAATLPVSLEVNRNGNSTPSATVAAASVPSLPPGFEKRVTAAEIQAALKNGEQDSLCSKGFKLHGVFKEGDENEFYCMTDEAAAKIERAKSKPIKASKQTRCEVPQATCGDPSKEREQIFQGKLPCVIAGMVSQLDFQNRRCQPVTSAGDLKCSERGQSICNPLLFGIRHDGAPVCVGRGQSVTKQCSELSSTLDVNRYLASGPPGVQERWDEFKLSLSSICKSGTVQARFHCQECNVMRQRLAEIHSRYGFGCTADSDATGAELIRSSKSPRRSQKREVSK